MKDPAWYANIAIIIYMMMILSSSLLRRVDPRKGTIAYSIHRVLFWITEPFLAPIRRVAPKIERGTVDWSMVIGLTILFLVLQIIRFFF
jgi:uncharacterized protein YggT (Ycf19 family)